MKTANQRILNRSSWQHFIPGYQYLTLSWPYVGML